MKKINLSGKKLLLDKTIIGNLDKSKMNKIVGGYGEGCEGDYGGGGGGEYAFLSIVSCHTYHGGSRCSGCQTCCSGGHCFA